MSIQISCEADFDPRKGPTQLESNKYFLKVANDPLFGFGVSFLETSAFLTPVDTLCTFFLGGSPFILVVAQKKNTFFGLVTGQVRGFKGSRQDPISSGIWRQARLRPCPRDRNPLAYVCPALACDSTTIEPFWG